MKRTSLRLSTGVLSLAAGLAWAGSDSQCLNTAELSRTQVERALSTGPVEQFDGVMFNICRNGSDSVHFVRRSIASGPRIGTIVMAQKWTFGQGDIGYQLSHGPNGPAATYCADGRVFLFDQLCAP